MKYLGSKERLANHIIPIITQDKEKYDLYIEPFCGSLAVIEKVTDIPKFASDINPYLIAMWKGINWGLNLDAPMEIPKSLYDEYRNKFNLLKKAPQSIIEYTINNVQYYDVDIRQLVTDDWEVTFRELFLIGWIGFMASFNGRFYDGGYSGKTDKRDYVDEQIRNTLKQIPKIMSIDTLEVNDYRQLFNRIGCKEIYNDFAKYKGNYLIYCDIPYKNSKKYAFDTNFDYDIFYDWCRLLSKRGHKIFISEYEMPDDFKCVWEMEVTNSMHPTKTKKPIEKLFTL